MLAPLTDAGTIQLTEYQPQRVLISEEDKAYLLKRFAKKITLSLEAVDGETFDVLNPGPHVGVLTLPSGRRLECRPKVDAANIFYMMSVAHELPDLEDELALFDRFDTLLEFVVDRFATLAEQRLQQGLHRRYLEREENLGVVRGRILITPDIRHNYALRHRTYCEFSELSWDIPENQVIRQVAFQMAGWDFRRDLRTRLMRIESQMAEVTPTRFTASVVDTFTYSRLNYEYEPLHQLCRLLLDASSVHEDEGEFEFRTFLINMNELFESYVAKSLAAMLPADLKAILQRHSCLDRALRVSIQPDVVVMRDDAPVLVLDTKYKRVEQDEFKNHDLYQVTAYCTALAVDRGMLVYPKHLVEASSVVQLRNSRIVIRNVTLDLSGDVDHLKAASLSLTKDISAWVDTVLRPSQAGNSQESA